MPSSNLPCMRSVKGPEDSIGLCLYSDSSGPNYGKRAGELVEQPGGQPVGGRGTHGRGESLGERSQSWRFSQDECIDNGTLSLHQENGCVRNISDTQIFGFGWLDGLGGRVEGKARNRKKMKKWLKVKTVWPGQSTKGEALGWRCSCDTHWRTPGCHSK